MGKQRSSHKQRTGFTLDPEHFRVLDRAAVMYGAEDNRSMALRRLIEDWDMAHPVQFGLTDDPATLARVRAALIRCADAAPEA